MATSVVDTPVIDATKAVQEKTMFDWRSGPMAWHADSQIDDHGIIVLDDASLRELHTVATILTDHPLPALLLNQHEFALERCRALCARIREQISTGVGFVIVERLPVDDYDDDIIVKLYWLLMGLIGRPVAQKWNGEMIYDVVDTGKKATAGSGVRSSKTNGGQVYHTDNSFNLPPEYVGLLCLRPALKGGESGLISFDSVYNRLLERHRNVLARLYQPVYFDRQREHAPDDIRYTAAPVFELNNSALKVRLATNLVRQGYIVADTKIDADADQALAALDDVMESDDLGKTFDFEPGQIQIVNNHRLGHRRTAFTDSPDPARKRHLVRIWLRAHGKRSYLG